MEDVPLMICVARSSEVCRNLNKSLPQVEFSLGTVTFESVGRGGTVKTRTTKNLPAREGKALIHKLELLKDTRPQYWYHEFIVLTLSYAGENRFLYLEHCWRANTGPLGEWIPLTSGSLAGSQKDRADGAMFYKTDDSEERDRRRCTMTVLEIQFADSPAHDTHAITLHTIAKILKQIETEHPSYALFSANCWAWSRGIVMAILLESRPSRRTTQTVTMSGTDITSDQLIFYLTTEYGAFGGLLLHCIGVSLIFQRVRLPDSLTSQRKAGETYIGVNITFCEAFAFSMASLTSHFG